MRILASSFTGRMLVRNWGNRHADAKLEKEIIFSNFLIHLASS